MITFSEGNHRSFIIAGFGKAVETIPFLCSRGSFNGFSAKRAGPYSIQQPFFLQYGLIHANSKRTVNLTVP